jgi:hypothetical protein
MTKIDERERGMKLMRYSSTELEAVPNRKTPIKSLQYTADTRTPTWRYTMGSFLYQSCLLDASLRSASAIDRTLSSIFVVEG